MQTRELKTINSIPAEYLDQGRLMSRPVTTNCGHVIQRIEFAGNCSNCGNALQNPTPNITLARRIKSYVESNRTELNLRSHLSELLHGADNLDGFLTEISTFIDPQPAAVIVDVRDDGYQYEEEGLLARMIHRYRRLDRMEQIMYPGIAACFALLVGAAIYNGVQEIMNGNNDSSSGK